MDNAVQIRELLKANQDKLVQDWLHLSGSQTRVHIDQFFKNLSTPDQDIPPPISDGYQLRQLIFDYKLLRDVVLNFIENRNEMNTSTRNFVIFEIDKMIRIFLETIVNETESKNDEIKDILDSINDGFFTVDKNFTITQVNEQHIRLSKKTRKEQIGKNFFDVFPETNDPESDYYKGYHKAMKERVFVTFESYYPPLDIWTKMNVIPRADGGIAGFFSDITLQKKSQQTLEMEKLKLEALFVDSAAPMALLRGKDFIYEKINPKYADLLKGRQILNKPLTEALPELKNTKLPEIMKEVYETGIPFVGKELLIPLIREAGGPLTDSYFDFTYSRVNDTHEKTYGIYIHAVDVTEKVNARKNIERALKTRDEFLSIASHELKTPLTSLKLQIQLAIRKIKVGEEKQIPTENLVSLFENNVAQVNRLILLVDDMLDISRIDSGKFSYHFEKYNLSRLVIKVFDDFKETYRNNSSNLSLDCPPEIYGIFDKERIEQILINLLTNALKYGERSPVEMALKLENDSAKISVTDRGRGIDESNHKKIFERFERLVSANEISGLGIGLFISKQIAEAHHGKITVKSSPGKGSTFTFIFPLSRNI